MSFDSRDSIILEPPGGNLQLNQISYKKLVKGVFNFEEPGLKYITL